MTAVWQRDERMLNTMQKHEKYIERNDLRDASHLQVSVFYDKGSMNYFSGQSAPRGFYLSVTPVTKGNGTVSFTMFTGMKRLLHDVSRYTDKQFHHAIELSKSYEYELITAVVNKNKAA